MPITKNQLRRDLRQFLNRKTFGIHRLKGIITPRQLKELKKPETTFEFRYWKVDDKRFDLLIERTSENVLHSGRCEVGGKKKRLSIYIADVCARLSENLDIFLLNGRNEDEIGEREIMLADEAELAEKCRVYRNHGLKPEGMLIEFTILVIAIRSIIKNFNEFLEQSSSSDEFLIKAMNLMINSTVTHEVAHLEERNATNNADIPEQWIEAIAYLIQARYSHAGVAFQSMMERNLDLRRVVSECFEEIKRKWPEVFLEKEDFLKKWAEVALSRIFREDYKQQIDVNAIIKSQLKRYLDDTNINIIKAIMYNPSIRRRQFFEGFSFEEAELI